MTEIWKKSRGNYEVSNEGRVRHHAGGFRKPRLDPEGYLALNIWENGKRVRVKVHRLVAEAFHGPCSPGMVARHLNGVATDNRAVNLKWGTVQENAIDSVVHGSHKGTRNGRSKLQEDDVLAIRASSESGPILGERYGISRVLVGKIKRREAWAWLP